MKNLIGNFFHDFLVKNTKDKTILPVWVRIYTTIKKHFRQRIPHIIKINSNGDIV